MAKRPPASSRLISPRLQTPDGREMTRGFNGPRQKSAFHHTSLDARRAGYDRTVHGPRQLSTFDEQETARGYRPPSLSWGTCAQNTETHPKKRILLKGLSNFQHGLLPHHRLHIILLLLGWWSSMNIFFLLLTLVVIYGTHSLKEPFATDSGKTHMRK